MSTPGIKKRGKRWQATYRGPDHKEHSRTFDRKIDASAWIADERSKINRGAWIDAGAGRISVSEFANSWLERKLKLSPRTRELYGYLLEKHIVPTFGSGFIGALRPSMIEAWHDNLSERRPSTGAKAYRLLSQIMRSAVRDKVIHENPCQIEGGGVESAPERPVASVAEVDAMADAMPADLRLTVLLAAWCQLRRGELLGLRRRDVDMLRGTLAITRSRVRMMNGEMIEKEPKSDAAKRTITIPPHVLPGLKEHLDRVEETTDSLLFTGPLGQPLPVAQLDRAWHKARRSVGRTDMHFHDLRHAGLTWSAATGATVAELMRRAGHASPAAALRYQHATEDRDRALADALSELAPKAKIIPLADKMRTTRSE